MENICPLNTYSDKELTLLLDNSNYMAWLTLVLLT